LADIIIYFQLISRKPYGTTLFLSLVRFAVCLKHCLVSMYSESVTRHYITSVDTSWEWLKVWSMLTCAIKI